MLQESIKVSLITGSVEQWIYLFLTRCSLLPILTIDLQRHPVHLEARTVLTKTDVVEVMKREFRRYQSLTDSIDQVIRGKEGYQGQGHIRLV